MPNHRNLTSFSDWLERPVSNASWLGHTNSPEQREILREDAIRIRVSRDLRSEIFDANLFGEPAWDILLALYVIDSVQRRLSTRMIADLANCPLTTALRWLDYLEQHDLICRLSNPVDQRMVQIEMSEKGRAAMDSYLVQMRNADIVRTSQHRANVLIHSVPD